MAPYSSSSTDVPIFSDTKLIVVATRFGEPLMMIADKLLSHLNSKFLTERIDRRQLGNGDLEFTLHLTHSLAQQEFSDLSGHVKHKDTENIGVHMYLSRYSESKSCVLPSIMTPADIDMRCQSSMEHLFKKFMQNKNLESGLVSVYAVKHYATNNIRLKFTFITGQQAKEADIIMQSHLARAQTRVVRRPVISPMMPGEVIGMDPRLISRKRKSRKKNSMTIKKPDSRANVADKINMVSSTDNAENNGDTLLYDVLRLCLPDSCILNLGCSR